MNNGQQLFYSVAGPTLLEVHLFTHPAPCSLVLDPAKAW